jgi:hypothetical protein
LPGLPLAALATAPGQRRPALPHQRPWQQKRHEAQAPSMSSAATDRMSGTCRLGGRPRPATGQIICTSAGYTLRWRAQEPASLVSRKNPAAVELGGRGGLKGGTARAKNMTKKQRSASAKKAARARGKKLTLNQVEDFRHFPCRDGGGGEIARCLASARRGDRCSSRPR